MRRKMLGWNHVRNEPYGSCRCPRLLAAGRPQVVRPCRSNALELDALFPSTLNPSNLSGPHHINPTFVVQLRLEGKGLWSAFHCIEECSSRAQGLSVRDPGSAEGLEFRFQGCILRGAWVVGLGSAFRKTEPKSKEPKSNRHAYIKRTDCHVHNHHPNQCQHHQLNISSKKAASD